MHLLQAANCGRIHFALTCASRKSAPGMHSEHAAARILSFLIALFIIRLREITLKKNQVF